MRRFFEPNPRLSLEFLPAYPPFVLPTMWLLTYVKRRSLGNLCARSLAESRGAWRRALARSFFAASAIGNVT